MRKVVSILIYFNLFMLLFQGLIFGQGVEIASGAKIEISGSAKIEIEDGSFTNNGTYTKDTDTIIFSGTSAGLIDGSVDTDFHDIIVSNTGGLTTQANATVNNVTVASGGVFEIGAAYKLTVSGVLTNSSSDDGLVVNSDATGSGELKVTGTSSGNATYKQYLTHDNWHLISAPFAGMSINTFVTTVGNSIATNASMYGLAPYDNTTKDWNHYTSSGDNLASAAGNFVSGKGYEALRASSSGTVDIVGTVETSDVSIGVTQGANSWNLIGNPFATSININDDAHATNNFLTVNTAELHDSYEAIYVWDPSADYITVNHVYASNTAFYLSPGQAFFVYSVDGGGTVDFTEAMQSDVAGSFYKKGIESEDFSIQLNVSDGINSRSTMLYYLDNTSSGLDPGYDAGRFTGGDNSFAIYSHLAGDDENHVDFGIQCLALGEYDLEIPIGLNARAKKDLIFSAEVVANEAAVPVILEDRELGVFTELGKDAKYSVNLPELESGFGRFFLHNIKQSSALSPRIEDGVSIVAAPAYEVIRIIGTIPSCSNISIYDISGHLLLQDQLHSENFNEVYLRNLKNGVYIAHISSGMYNFTKKFVWIQ